jgi:MerR family transcriptional regulator, redox-sensitive transcriptional activator SoxR
VIRRISLIQVAKRLGIPLQSVAEVFADLPHEKEPSNKDWARIAKRWEAELNARKLAIEKLQNELTGVHRTRLSVHEHLPLAQPHRQPRGGGAGSRRLDSTEYLPHEQDMNRAE